MPQNLTPSLPEPSQGFALLSKTTEAPSDLIKICPPKTAVPIKPDVRPFTSPIAPDQGVKPLWLVLNPAPKVERSFADIDTMALPAVAQCLQGHLAQPVYQVLPSQQPDWHDSLNEYQHLKDPTVLSPAHALEHSVLLISSWVSTLQANAPQTLINKLRWAVNDTSPSYASYQLVLQAQLLAPGTRHTLWQHSTYAPIVSSQLTTLSRSVQQVASNQAALQVASQQASQKLSKSLRLWLQQHGDALGAAQPTQPSSP
jgi:hypothetical protein